MSSPAKKSLHRDKSIVKIVLIELRQLNHGEPKHVSVETDIVKRLNAGGGDSNAPPPDMQTILSS